MKWITPRRVDLFTGCLAGLVAFCLWMGTADYQSLHCKDADAEGSNHPTTNEIEGKPSAQHGENADTDQEGKHAKPKPSFSCSILGFPKALIAFMDHHEGFFVGGFTAALFISTLLLWRTTADLYEAGERQGKLARDEFIATHRPRLTLRGASSQVTDPEEENIVVRYSLVNTGESPLRVVWEVVGLEWTNYVGYPAHWTILNAEESNSLTTLIALAPGQSVNRPHESPNHKWDYNHRDLCMRQTDPLGLHFVGHVIYEDDNGIRRQIAWRRRYDINIQRFVRIKDLAEEYEYED